MRACGGLFGKSEFWTYGAAGGFMILRLFKKGVVSFFGPTDPLCKGYVSPFCTISTQNLQKAISFDWKLGFEQEKTFWKVLEFIYAMRA